MSRNLYDIARELKAPGVQTVATFNPTRLTKTLRNMVRKSITSGKHNGGWSSKTKAVRKLVFKLAGEEPIVYAMPTHGNYLSFVSSRTIAPDVFAEMKGLLEADAALSKMNFEEEKKGYYKITYAEFVERTDGNLKDNLTRLGEVGGRTHYSLLIRNRSIRDQLVDAFLTQRTPEEVAIAERIARYLDNDVEFPIPTSHRF